MSIVAETYIPCVGLPAKINAVAAVVEKGGFTLEFETDETTNDAGYGNYEDCLTINFATFTMGLAAKSATPTLGLVSGGIYPILINCASLPAVTSGVMAAPTPINPGPAFAGNCRLKFDGANVLDAKAAVHIAVSGKTQGAFSYLI